MAWRSRAYAWSRNETVALIGASESVTPTGLPSARGSRRLAGVAATSVSDGIDGLMSQVPHARRRPCTRAAALVIRRQPSVPTIVLRALQHVLRHRRCQCKRHTHTARYQGNSDHD